MASQGDEWRLRAGLLPHTLLLSDSGGCMRKPGSIHQVPPKLSSLGKPSKVKPARSGFLQNHKLLHTQKMFGNFTEVKIIFLKSHITPAPPAAATVSITATVSFLHFSVVLRTWPWDPQAQLCVPFSRTLRTEACPNADTL